MAIYNNEGFVIGDRATGGDTSGNIVAADLLQLDQYTQLGLQIYAPALAGRQGYIEIRASRFPPATHTVAWATPATLPLVHSELVGAADINKAICIDRMGLVYYAISYAHVAGGQAADLAVYAYAASC